MYGGFGGFPRTVSYGTPAGYGSFGASPAYSYPGGAVRGWEGLICGERRARVAVCRAAVIGSGHV